MRTAAAKSAPVRVLCLVPRESETEMEVTSAVVHSHLFRSPVPRASGTEPETEPEVTCGPQLRTYVMLLLSFYSCGHRRLYPVLDLFNAGVEIVTSRRYFRPVAAAVMN